MAINQMIAQGFPGIGATPAFLRNRQQAFENDRANALLELDRQNYGLNERRVVAEETRLAQAEQQRLAQRASRVGILKQLLPPEMQDQAEVLADDPDAPELIMELQASKAPKPPDYRAVGNTLLRLDDGGVTPVYQGQDAPQKPGFGAAQPGINPNTNKPDMFVLDDYGNQKWLGTEPIPPASSQPKPLSPKEAVTAKTKLTLIRQAKQQLALVKQRIQEAKGGTSGGYFGVQGLIPSEKGKLFDGAVDSMRNIITSLTRTPGIGANSDFETRLQQAQLPVRTDREAVQDQKAQSMEDLLNALEEGYSDILGDGGSSQPPPQSSGGPRRIRYNKKGQRVPNGS